MPPVQTPGPYNPPPQAPPYQGPPNSWLAPAILSTVLCCLPSGIVAIVYASQVSTKWNSGDYNGALSSANNAKTWTLLSIGLFFLGMIGYFAFVMLVMSQDPTVSY